MGIPMELWNLGGMTMVTAVLLWAIVGDRRQYVKTLQAMSVTLVTHQQLLLICRFRMSDDKNLPEECKQCTDCLQQAVSILNDQRQSLERIFSQ